MPFISAAAIDVAALIAELQRWVEIETPTRDAGAVNDLVDVVEVSARARGFVVARIAGPHGTGDALVARSPRPTDDPRKSILVLCHLDTVHALGTLAGPLPLRRDGDQLFGPGIYDMKAGALMALTAAELATKAGTRLPIDVVFTADEETGSHASRDLIETLAARAAYALVVEPARDGGKIVVARKGVGMFDVIVSGRAAHAGTRPQDGRSAIRAAARLVLDLETMNDAARGVSVTVGTIRGGTGRNTVPAECHLEVDVRVPDAATAETVFSAISGWKPAVSGVTATFRGGLNRPPFAQSAACKALFDKAAVIAGDLGFELEGVSTGGGSDGNFTAALGVPTLDGLGADGAGAHTFDEHIFVSSLAPRTALLANLLATLDSP